MSDLDQSHVDAVAEEINGLTVGSGYYQARVCMDEAREAAEAVLTSTDPAVHEALLAAVAPLIEARARDARADELDFVAAEFERSANRIEKAKGATERTKFMRELVEVLRNRAREVRDA